MWYWHKDTQISQQNIDKAEINPLIYGQLIRGNDVKTAQ